MSRIAIFGFIFFAKSFVYAQNSQIIKCRVDNSQWKAVFQLDAVGGGLLKFNQAHGETYSCSLKLQDIDDGQRAVVPQVRVELTRNSCNPELPQALEQEVFSNLTLMVNFLNKEKPKGIVQWLRRKQPDVCEIEKLSLYDIQRNAKKWIEGTWGRKTAGEPKPTKEQK